MRVYCLHQRPRVPRPLMQLSSSGTTSITLPRYRFKFLVSHPIRLLNHQTIQFCDCCSVGGRGMEMVWRDHPDYWQRVDYLSSLSSTVPQQRPLSVVYSSGTRENCFICVSIQWQSLPHLFQNILIASWKWHRPHQNLLKLLKVISHTPKIFVIKFASIIVILY